MTFEISLNPPWIQPRYTSSVEGFYYDEKHRLRKVTVIYARDQWLTLNDKAIEIIGWK